VLNAVRTCSEQRKNAVRADDNPAQKPQSDYTFTRKDV